MQTIRHQHVAAMETTAVELAAARIESEVLGQVTPDALAASVSFAPHSLGTTHEFTGRREYRGGRGARAALGRVAAQAAKNADTDTELDWDADMFKVDAS